MINRLFDHFDTNKDGKIDKAEVKRKVEESRKKFQQRIEQHRRQRSGGDRGRGRGRGSRSSAGDNESKEAELTKTA